MRNLHVLGLGLIVVKDGVRAWHLGGAAARFAFAAFVASALGRGAACLREQRAKAAPIRRPLVAVHQNLPCDQEPSAPEAHVVCPATKETDHGKRDLALFNLAIDSKLRGCDVVTVRVEDLAPNGYALDRVMVRQKKTGRPARFELTDQTRQALDEYLNLADRRPGQFLFSGRNPSRGLTTRQYARLVGEWVGSIGLDPLNFGTQSLRRTKAVLIYRRAGHLRAVQLLLGHSKIESTVRYLGIEVDDAIEIAEKIDI